MKDQLAWWMQRKRRRRKKGHLWAKKVVQERMKDRDGENSLMYKDNVASMKNRIIFCWIKEIKPATAKALGEHSTPMLPPLP